MSLWAMMVVPSGVDNQREFGEWSDSYKPHFVEMLKTKKIRKSCRSSIRVEDGKINWWESYRLENYYFLVGTCLCSTDCIYFWYSSYSSMTWARIRLRSVRSKRSVTDFSHELFLRTFRDRIWEMQKFFVLCNLPDSRVSMMLCSSASSCSMGSIREIDRYLL